MTCPCSRSRFRWIRNFCSLFCLVAGCCSLPAARADEVPSGKPVQTIDEEITAFAFAPDGRIAYAVRHLMKTKLYDLQRDDIWLQDAKGKRRRLLEGEKLAGGEAPFSYSVTNLRWSPDGRMILAEIFATFVTDERGNTSDAPMGILLDENGKLFKMQGAKGFLFDALSAGWLSDSATIVFLSEAVKPNLLYGIRYLRYTTGNHGPLFAERTFVDADWFTRGNVAVAVERDRALAGPPRIQLLNLAPEADREVATLDSYAGGMTISPSGGKIAYFLDHEVMEIRDLANPARAARLRVGYGAFHWSLDERRILLKRAPEKKSGDLVWVDVPALSAPSANPADKSVPVLEPTLIPIFSGITFRDFAFSPDGRYLAVVPPGRRNLLLYDLASVK